MGDRIYAVGDIHGRLDCLDALLAMIEADDAARGPADTKIIFLGDLVDRGPQSAQVVQRLLELENRRPAGSIRFLLGNHEEVFLAVLSGSAKALRFFERIGGRETILSYGFPPERYPHVDSAELIGELQRLVAPEHVAFLQRFENLIVVGDYAFVHAGIRPQVPLEQQQVSDLRWIREEFLSSKLEFDKLIVHGHTITEAVDECEHRIGLDTGAFATGRLSAMGFERDQRWILQSEIIVPA